MVGFGLVGFFHIRMKTPASSFKISACSVLIGWCCRGGRGTRHEEAKIVEGKGEERIRRGKMGVISAFLGLVLGQALLVLIAQSTLVLLLHLHPILPSKPTLIVWNTHRYGRQTQTSDRQT